MTCCNINGCNAVGKSIEFLPGKYVLCDKHCMDLFKLLVEECGAHINSDSVAGSLAQISIKMERNPIPSVLSGLDEEDDLHFGTGSKI